MMRSSRGWCTDKSERSAQGVCSLRENDAECERSGSLRIVDGAPSSYAISTRSWKESPRLNICIGANFTSTDWPLFPPQVPIVLLLTPVEPPFLFASISPPSSSLLFWTPHQTKQFLFIITSHLACTAPFRACGLEHALTADWPSSRQILVFLPFRLCISRELSLPPRCYTALARLPASLASQACPSLGEKRLTFCAFRLKCNHIRIQDTHSALLAMRRHRKGAREAQPPLKAGKSRISSLGPRVASVCLPVDHPCHKQKDPHASSP